MAKEIDTNSYWYIKHNPISKVGVFPYLGKTISDECEPEKIYYVFRSPDTLRDSVPTWDNPPKPVIEDHEMLGEGFTKIDNRPIQGIIYNPVFDDSDGVLYADLAIYSEDMKDKIANGKKEISLGYFCKYTKEHGVYAGQEYDYIQTDMVGNHCAIVENGRCGSDVKVFDSKITMDALDINPDDLKTNAECDNIEITTKESTTNQKENDMADKREAIRKIMAIAAKPDSEFDGGESEKIETIAKLLEDSEYAKSETGKDEDVDAEKKDEKAQDKCGKDEDVEAEKETKDEDEEKKAEDDDISAADVLAAIRALSDQVQGVLAHFTVAKDEEEEKAEDEDEEKKDSETKDEDEDGEKKSAEDSAVVVDRKVAQDAQDDPALAAYLA